MNPDLRIIKYRTRCVLYTQTKVYFVDAMESMQVGCQGVSD